MIVYNDAVKHSSTADIALLNAYMNNKRTASFDDVRNDNPPLSGFNDGELSQLVQDAGFRHTE